jgi:hypothetical protein
MKTSRTDPRPAPARTESPRDTAVPAPAARNEAKAQPQAALRPEDGNSQFDAKARKQPNAAALGGAQIALQPSRVDPGSYPSVADINAISSIKDPVARNLAITQGYSDLSNGLGELLGKENANWSTFATWASKQAGVSIRQEDLPKFLTDAFKASGAVGEKLSQVDDVLRKLGLPALPLGDIAGAAQQSLNNVSKAIADGNQFVFKEVGQEFSRFIDTFKNDTHFDAAKVDKYLAEFPADKPLLKEAFGTYAKAMFEQDPNKKAEMMLLANDKIGLHEQTQLQPFIEKALNTAVKDTFKNILSQSIDAGINSLPFGAKQAAQLLKRTGIVDAAVNPLVDALAGAFRRFSTEHMMKLAVPGGALKLGNDLPPPAGMEKDIFPPHLRTIENPELKALLGKLDRSQDSLRGTAAKDWGRLDERMNYIVDLFRSRNSDPRLFDPPFGRTGRYPVAPTAPRGG